jgi:capsular exopolysaccharide synthesis family protein
LELVSTARPSSLRDYAQILRRRKWLLLACALLIPAAAVALSLKQPASYRATAEVLLNRQDLSAALSNSSDSSSGQDPGRYASTQAELARVPAVADAAIRQSKVSVPLKDFLGDSSVSTSPDSDLLEFQVDHSSRSGARDLVNGYARAFVGYRRGLDTDALKRAQRDVDARLRSIEEAGDRQSALYRSLSAKADELRTLLAVQTPHAILVRTADSAAQTQPKPVRNGLLALVIAIGLGGALAFLLDSLDTRVGSAVDIAEALKLPLLARLPRPPRQGGIVMLGEPDTPAAEAFRVLRTNLELVNLERDARTIMVASAVPEEGKSTTIANLAVAAARAGKTVVLVDLDLRRGDVDHLFGIVDKPGVSDVALGRLNVPDALVPIEIRSEGSRQSTGSLHVLPAGHLPPSAGEVAASERIGDILAEVSAQADLTLIDAPPFLQVGDAMALSARAEGVIVVTRLDVRQPVLDEIRRALDRFRAVPLGVVVTGDQGDENIRTGYEATRLRSSEIADPVG